MNYVAKFINSFHLLVTFVEIKGASLLTPGQSGLQVIRLNDRATLQVEPDDIVVRDGTVFLKEQIARSAGIPSTDLGMMLEMVEGMAGSALHYLLLA